MYPFGLESKTQAPILSKEDSDDVLHKARENKIGD